MSPSPGEDPSPPRHGARRVLLPPPAAAVGDEGRGSRPGGSRAAEPIGGSRGTAEKTPFCRRVPPDRFTSGGASETTELEPQAADCWS